MKNTQEAQLTPIVSFDASFVEGELYVFVPKKEYDIITDSDGGKNYILRFKNSK